MNAADAIEKMRANRAAMEAAVVEKRKEAGSARLSLLRAWLVYKAENDGATKEAFLAWAAGEIP